MSEEKLEALMKQFVPWTIACDYDTLDDDIKEALPHIVDAMRMMDPLFHAQVGPQVVELFDRLESDKFIESPLQVAVRHFNGPYNKLEGGKSFVEGIEGTPPQKALYPADITEQEFDDFIKAHPDRKEDFVSPTTVIVRKEGGLEAIPYHVHYKAMLQHTAESLQKAASIVKHEGLKTFLNNRALALIGEYPMRDSDAEWVRLTDAPLEIVIGPFEVYEDGLKGLKAFYEGMLFAVDFEAGARLKKIEESLKELAAHIPVPAGAKPAMGGMAPMVVANEILATGDGYSGILAAAFNLPNDPWVRGEVGWKQVMIKNVMQAKFDACTSKIAERRLITDQVDFLNFDAYFFFVLLHEVTHGLGPAYRADGRTTNEAGGKYYTALEEAKADTGSVVLMIEKNGTCGIPKLSLENIGATYLAGLYRSTRFGLHEAHGKANVVEYTFFRREGVLVEEGDKIRVKPELLPAASKKLLDKLCTLQASGTEEEMKAFLDDYGTAPEELEQAVQSLSDLPVDILPQYDVVR